MLFVALLVLNCKIKYWYLDLVRVRKSLPKACKESLSLWPVHATLVLRIHVAVLAVARADLHPAATALGRELRLAVPAEPGQAQMQIQHKKWTPLLLFPRAGAETPNRYL